MESRGQKEAGCCFGHEVLLCSLVNLKLSQALPWLFGALSAFWDTVVLSGPWCSLPRGAITLLLALSSIDKGDVDDFETLPRRGRQRFPLSLPQRVF